MTTILRNSTIFPQMLTDAYVFVYIKYSPIDFSTIILHYIMIIRYYKDNEYRKNVHTITIMLQKKCRQKAASVAIFKLNLNRNQRSIRKSPRRRCKMPKPKCYVNRCGWLNTWLVG